jgi:hypothetical protein
MGAFLSALTAKRVLGSAWIVTANQYLIFILARHTSKELPEITIVQMDCGKQGKNVKGVSIYHFGQDLEEVVQCHNVSGCGRPVDCKVAPAVPYHPDRVWVFRDQARESIHVALAGSEEQGVVFTCFPEILDWRYFFLHLGAISFWLTEKTTFHKVFSWTIYQVLVLC